MSETKFTKGEWSVSYGLVVIGDVHYDIENKDDAHLIAAAPEMYTMLETAMNILNGDDAINEVDSSDIEALLAKARGEK